MRTENWLSKIHLLHISPWHKPDEIGTSVDEVISQLWWYKNIMCLINLFLILFILRCAKINSSKYDLNVYQCGRKFVFSIWHKTQWLSWLFTTCIIIGMVDWANTSVIGWGWVLFFAKFLLHTIFAVFRLVTWNVRQIKISCMIMHCVLFHYKERNLCSWFSHQDVAYEGVGTYFFHLLGFDL